MKFIVPSVRVHLPRILADAVGFPHATLDAHTPTDLLRELSRHPLLGSLLFDDEKRLRKHLMLFVNEVATRHMSSLDRPLTDRDHIQLVQATSGG
jgi:molybdopterin converting factor small subunit